MKEYVLTSTKFTGEIRFKYFSSGYLKGFEINSEDMTDKQIEWLLNHCPLSELDLDYLRAKGSYLTLREVPLVLTFDLFWERYGYKEDKQEAMKVWAKMPSAEQLLAYEYVNRYNAKLAATGVGKKYAKTYLRQKPWIE